MTDTNTEMVKATPTEVYVPRKTPEYLMDRMLPDDFEGMCRLANLFAQSGMFGVKSEAVALSIMWIGLKLGVDYTTALQTIYINEKSGKPALYADLLYGLVMRHPECKFFRVKECSPTRATWETQRGDNPTVEISATWEEAVKAGLSTKQTYQNYPMDMLNAWAKRRLTALVWGDVKLGFQTVDEAEDVEYIEGQASRPALSSPEPTPLPPRVIEPVAPDLSGLRYRYQALVKELSPERKKLAAGKIKDVLGSTTPGDLGADQLDAAIKIVQEAGEGKYDAAPAPEVEPVAQPAMDLEPPKSAEPEPPKYEAVLDSAGAPIDKAKLYGTIRNKQQLLSEAQNLALREIWGARYDGERNLLKLKIPQMQECLAEVDEALAGSEVDPFEDNLELGLDPEANN